MTEFVELYLKRNRGWPWPEDSWGMTPMYGEDGWCRSCGTPLHAQTGSLVLQRKGMARVEGSWIPNWQFNAVCLGPQLAGIADRFPELQLLPVQWRGTAPQGRCLQIVAPTATEPWFDEEELRAKVIARHGSAGNRCAGCGTWRWFPLGLDALPPLQVDPETLADTPLVAGPDWFGDGWNSFHELLVRRDLAELLAAASPRDFGVNEVRWR